MSTRRLELEGCLNRIHWLRPNWCLVPFFAILEFVWHLLAQGTTYRELGADYLHRRNTGQMARRHVGFLETLGYRVTLEPVPAAA